MATPSAITELSSESTQASHSIARLAAITIGFSFALRLVFLGLQELLPEEAYYWQFAQHLDWSYLDHPGMVAWLISLGTSVFGHNEFGTRSLAIFCSAWSAFFLWKLACLLFNREIALSAVMLFAALPYFFVSGYLITPDSPLMLFWTATLYFLVLALRDSSHSAWLCVGVTMGLGMISKYSIALLGAATLLFMLLHRPSRRWFLSPWPYVAACITALLFTPVLYWNANHDWASFSFQTSRRLQAPSEFGIPTLLTSILCLVTPTGMVAAWLALVHPNGAGEADGSEFRALFLRVFLGVPLAVFTVFSITHIPKLNWTGPSFVIALPFFAALLHAPTLSQRLPRIVVSCWPATLAVLFFLYTGALSYFQFGLPFVGYLRGTQRYVGWADLGRQIGTLLESQAGSAGTRPVVVGMDKHFLASEIGFYTPAQNGAAPLPVGAVAGRNIFGLNSLMWALWEPKGLEGTTLLLMARSTEDLEKPEISNFVSSLEPIHVLTTQMRGNESGKFYYRWAFGYQSTRRKDTKAVQ